MAALELVVNEKIPVYRKTKSKKPAFFLKPGMRVRISKRSKGPWRRIYITKKKKTYKAWVNTKKIKKSRVRFTSKDDDFEEIKKARYLGLYLVANYTLMGEQSVSDGGGSSSEFDSMSGSSSYFGFYYERPYKEKAYIRISVSMSKAKVSGSGKYAGSGSPAEVSIDQDFISLHFLYRNYFKKNNRLWWALGAGVDNGNNVELTINGSSEALTGDALPFYARVISGVGYDYPISKKMFLESSANLSYVANADKTILPVDLLLSIKRAF